VPPAVPPQAAPAQVVPPTAAPVPVEAAPAVIPAAEAAIPAAAAEAPSVLTAAAAQGPVFAAEGGSALSAAAAQGPVFAAEAALPEVAGAAGAGAAVLGGAAAGVAVAGIAGLALAIKAANDEAASLAQRQAELTKAYEDTGASADDATQKAKDQAEAEAKAANNADGLRGALLNFLNVKAPAAPQQVPGGPEGAGYTLRQVPRVPARGQGNVPAVTEFVPNAPGNAPVVAASPAGQAVAAAAPAALVAAAARQTQRPPTEGEKARAAAPGELAAGVSQQVVDQQIAAADATDKLRTRFEELKLAAQAAGLSEDDAARSAQAAALAEVAAAAGVDKHRSALQQLIGQASEPGTIAAFQQQISEIGTVRGAQAGPNFPLRAQTPQQVINLAQLDAQARAAALAEQEAAGRAAEAQQAGLSDRQLDIQTARNQPFADLINAQHQQAVVANEAAAAQARVSSLNEQAQLRQLSVQPKINALAQQRLEIEGKLGPLLLQQQRTQDAIALIKRPDLGIQQVNIQAQAAAVGPAAAVEQTTFEEQQAQARIRVAYAQIAKGQQPSFAIGEQVSTLATKALSPQTYIEQLQNLEAQHQVAQTGFAVQASQLGKAQEALPFEQIAQDLQSVILPAQQIEQSIDASLAVIQRSIDAASLLAGPALISAQTDLANALQAEAAAAERIASAQANVNQLPPVNVTINVGDQTNSSLDQGAINAMIKQIQDATATGVIDGIIRSQSQTSPRISPDIAAAHR
jgi:hypothetical protein